MTLRVFPVRRPEDRLTDKRMSAPTGILESRG
jgi:hypothetical protein